MPEGRPTRLPYLPHRTTDMLHWFLHGCSKIASSRIHGLQIHHCLRRLGVASNLFLTHPDPIALFDLPWKELDTVARLPCFAPGDMVIFQTLRGPRACGLARRFQAQGIKVAYIECDYHEDSEILKIADTVICTSKYLAATYARIYGRPVGHAPDPVEDILSPEELATRTRPVRRDLLIGWVGHEGHWSTLRPLQEILRRPEFCDFRLVTVTNHPQADFKWSLRRTRQLLRHCDLVAIPTRKTVNAFAKSPNRVTQAMALGAPVLCGKIPSYLDVVEDGVNGFLCEEPEEWADALRRVRDPEFRRVVSLRGWELARKSFALEPVCRMWAAELGLSGRGSANGRAAVLPPRLQQEQLLNYSGWCAARGLWRKAALFWARSILAAPTSPPLAEGVRLSVHWLRSLPH